MNATQAQTQRPAAKPVPDHMNTVSAHLVCAGGVEAIEFYKRAFGAEELTRVMTPDGKLMHAGLKIGNSTVMLVDEMPDWHVFGPLTLKGTPVTIHLQVENADEWFARAIAAGAKEIMPMSDAFWGDRYGQVEDPCGHRWSIATHMQDLTQEEILEAMKNAFCGEGCGGER